MIITDGLKYSSYIKHIFVQKPLPERKHSGRLWDLKALKVGNAIRFTTFPFYITIARWVLFDIYHLFSYLSEQFFVLNQCWTTQVRLVHLKWYTLYQRQQTNFMVVVCFKVSNESFQHKYSCEHINQDFYKQ